MYLERSWRRWRFQRWCQIAAKGRPSWTRKLSQPEMGFLEYFWSSHLNKSINQWIKCYLIQVADITLASYSQVIPTQPGGLPLPLLLLIHSKDDLLTQSEANLFPAEHSSLVQKPQRKTTFQSRLRIAAQETETTRKKMKSSQNLLFSSVLCDLS